MNRDFSLVEKIAHIQLSSTMQPEAVFSNLNSSYLEHFLFILARFAAGILSTECFETIDYSVQVIVINIEMQDEPHLLSGSTGDNALFG